METRAHRHSGATSEAIVWRRSDFRESSRVVTLITREEGKINALVKGAHRPTSPALGKIDLFNRIEARIGGPRSGLRLLSRLRLLHEPRALRTPQRYLTTCHLHDIFDSAFTAGRADPPLFDLLSGGLTLIERCPIHSLPTVSAGLELRYLKALGLLPELDRCSQCGTTTRRLFVAPLGRGLLCAKHANGHEPTLSAASGAWLRALAQTPGRSWPGLAAPPRDGRAGALLGLWIGAALERAPRFR